MAKIINEENAIQFLKKGFPLGFPTDTLPAIGCMPEFAEIIYQFKKRDKKKSLILMGSDISQIINYVHPSALDDFIYLAEKFWPGPLTLVVPKAEESKLLSLSQTNTIGLRVPDLSIARSLFKEIGPLATSSANISGLSTSLTAEEIANNLPNLYLLGPIPWEKCSGKASTVISWVKEGEWEVIRQGQIIISDFDQ